MKSKNLHNLGIEGEKIAKKHLLEKGYVILSENWRFKKYEIDIIAAYKNTLIIVEVKARSSNDFGEPETFVAKQKQNFLITAANEYIISNKLDMECRFDIVSVLVNSKEIKIKHFEDAFYPSIK